METTEFYFQAKWFFLKKYKNRQHAEDFAAFAVIQKLGGNRSTELNYNSLSVDYIRSTQGRNDSRHLRESNFTNELPKPKTPEQNYLEFETARLIDKSCLSDIDRKLTDILFFTENDSVFKASTQIGIQPHEGYKRMKAFIKRVSYILVLLVASCTTPKKCIESKDDPALSVDERASIVSECYVKGNY
jgi:hypothetical protein